MAEEYPKRVVGDIDYLTNKELEIAALLSNGMATKEIAKDLGISDRTVSYHLQHIYRKLDVNNKVSAINKLKELKLI